MRKAALTALGKGEQLGSVATITKWTGEREGRVELTGKGKEQMSLWHHIHIILIHNLNVS